MIIKLAGLAFAFLLPVIAFSQPNHDPVLWDYLELAIKQKKNLRVTFSRLEDIKTSAQKNKDYIIYARAQYYQLLITDARTEDSLYFRNSAFIDSTLQDPGTPAPLQLIMHLLQARRLAGFRNRSAYNKARYKTSKFPYNYAAFTDDMLDSTIQFHYEQAKSLSPAYKNQNPENYTWLSSNPLVFLFKPTMNDLIQAEQIDYNVFVCWFGNSWKKQFSLWLKLSPPDFIKALDTVQSKSREVVILRLFRDWLGQHKKDSAAFFFIESLARKYIYEKVRTERFTEPVYEKYLLAGIESSFREVKAHTVYQLCLLWNSRARNNEYTTKKFPPAKALELYENNRSLFDDFAFLGRILEVMKKQILESSISWKMNGGGLPGEPLLAKIEYKNASSLYYRVIPLNNEEQLPKNQDSAILYLLNKKYLRSVQETLPVTDDLDKHKTLLKIDPLPPGNYSILFAPNEIKGFDKGITRLTIQVTQTAIVASDNRVYMLNRKTGLPLEGVQVRVTNRKDLVTTRDLLNRQGYVLLKKRVKYIVEVFNGSDTLMEYVDASEDDPFYEVYDKESDDLLEYYIDNAKIHMLTDRSIYRPGQTVYYKGILMTKDPYTGANIIVTKKNLQQGPFRNFLKKWLNEEKPEIYIADPFRRGVDTIPVKPNAYGAISGSFRIPATAATGTWHFDGDIDLTYWDAGSFSVEEYKRPTFELTAEPPAKTYLPGDTVTFKLKVRSFAGSTMANTKIKYNITRAVPFDMPEGTLEQMEVDSVMVTGENGVAAIVIADTALRNASLPDSVKWNFRYTLTATAVDLSGESHDINSTLQVSSRPVSINLPVKGKYYINDLKPILITAKDPNKVELSRNIKVKVFRESSRGVKRFPGLTNYADQWKYPEAQLAQWFPDIVFRYDDKGEPELVYETTINTGASEKLRIPVSVLTAGEYTVRAACYDNNILRGEEKSAFTVYDTVSAHLPGSTPSFFHLPVNYINPGGSVLIYTGSAFDSTYLLLQIKYYSRQRKKLVIVPLFMEQLIKAGIHSYKFQVPKNVTDHAVITSCFIRDNEIWRHSEKVWISQQSKQPAIIIEQFRSKLTPGQQTTFAVSVKTKNHNVAAELMSTLYDASLDKLQKHKWEIPRLNLLNELSTEWPRYLDNEVSGKTFFNRPVIPPQEIKHPVWWMRNTLQKPTDRFWDQEFEKGDDEIFTRLQGRVAGLTITQTTGLNDVVVIGYGSTKRSFTGASAIIYIRGSSSIAGDWNQLLVVLDGVPYTGKLDELNTAEITEMMVLKGADATAIYGSRAANGVILISTKGPVKIPATKQEPVVKVRSNFNELAFFYPAVHADAAGYYRFTFTVPESLTEWNWKLFAHTKKAQFAYAERKLSTQLPFMILPNMPKLLYQGDQLILKSRISNLDSLRRTGKTVCKVEDAVTGEDITATVFKNIESVFDVAGNSNTVTGSVLNIPKDQLNPIKITIKAIAGDYADGEEHIIPILTDKILVKQAVPFSLSNHRDTLISLPAEKELYGLGLSIQAKPSAMLINSLPFLANYSFDCAEQTFNKMLANIMAVDIMRRDQAAQRVFEKAKAATEMQADAASLPGEIDEQTMPWLQLTSHTAMQQKQLFRLFDTVRTKKTIEGHLGKLYKLQNKDGGLCWFEGGKSNPYISAYVLAGFGKLAEQPGNPAFFKEEKTRIFIDQLIQYMNGNLNDLFRIYARGYWRGNYPVTQNDYIQIEKCIKQQWEEVEKAGLYQQALLIITSLQWFDQKNTLYEKALQQLEHIRQLAIEDPVNGIRWKALADADDMTVSTEETLALLAEAFGKTSGSAPINEGIIKWVLASKADHEWRSTKAVAAAINLLQKTTNTVTGSPNILSSTINNQSITVTDDLLNGQPVSIIKASHVPEALSVRKASDAIAHGNIIVWHFMPASQVNQLNTGIQLKKHLFRFSTISKKWEPVGESTLLNVSDKLKVVISIETAVNLPFVYIDDKTSGAFESTDLHSGYEYASGVQYYKSVRDAGMQFFSDLIPAGRTEISYELTVIQEGTFTNGPASLQCMYKPEKTAYSNSILIKTQDKNY